MGAVPARRAKHASVRRRPGCDQLMRSCAAVIGPTPVSSSSCGQMVLTHRSMSRLCWLASSVALRQRFAIARSDVMSDAVCGSLRGGRSFWQVMVSWAQFLAGDGELVGVEVSQPVA